MQTFIPEVLKEINDKPDLLVQYKNDAALKLIFQHAFLPEFKFELPEGEPPYKEDAAPLGMNPAVFKQELKKLYVFCRKDLKPIRRETLFVQLLENIHPTEAKVLLAIKDQTLNKMYPNITHKVVAEAGFIPAPVVEEKVKKPRAKKSQEVTE